MIKISEQGAFMFTLIAVYNLLALIRDNIPSSYRVDIFIEGTSLGITVWGTKTDGELRKYTKMYTTEEINNLTNHGVLLDFFIEKANLELC